MKRCIKVLANIWFVFSLLTPTVVFGQALKPTYIGEMPPPARIISEIKGKDAEDTIERQMGAFQALIKIIDDRHLDLKNVTWTDQRTLHRTRFGSS
jgi:hypothetical protein